jgi:tetratricopeptide (TPR) repeat protein
VAIGAIASIACLAGPAHADSRAELEKARASFLARHWQDAEERLRALLDDPKSGLKERALISQARMYLGASLLAQGKKDEAKEVFEKLVLDDPTYEPDPLSFPADAINTYIDVRSSLLEQIRTATQTAARLAAERKAREEAEREAQRIWLEKVKAQAAEEKITVRHSRLVAFLPLGAGQFQNGQPVLGWTFLGTQVAALAGTAVTWGMYSYARHREAEELNGDNQLSEQWHQRAEEIRLANLGFTGAFLVLAAAGIVQANLAFVPESAEKKKRDLPPLELPPRRSELERGRAPLEPDARGDDRRPALVSRSSIAPSVSALPGRDGSPGGVFVGVRGLLF